MVPDDIREREKRCIDERLAREAMAEYERGSYQYIEQVIAEMESAHSDDCVCEHCRDSELLTREEIHNVADYLRGQNP